MIHLIACALYADPGAWDEAGDLFVILSERRGSSDWYHDARWVSIL